MSRRCLSLLAVAYALWLPATAASNELVVYGSRQPVLIEPLLQIFSEHRGVSVRYVQEKTDPLLKRLREEGNDSPADVILTADIGVLDVAREEGLLQPLSSALLSNLVPAGYRDADGHWFGLSLRARVILFAPDRIDGRELRGYADLSSPALRGRVCIRSSRHVYNRSLTAALLVRWGPDRTREWVRGLAANLARPPEGGDRDQIRALAAGICDVAVANSYYYAMMLSSEDENDRKAAAAADLVWPQDGVHVNVSGGGVARHAPHPRLAVEFLEFLAGYDRQRLFSELNHEYPVVAGVPVSRTLLGLGAFVADHRPLTAIARQRKAAEEILTKSAWK